MLERLNPILRLVCLALAALILFQLSRIVSRRQALAKINVGAPLMTQPIGTKTNKAPAAVPPEITARVEKIKNSQILGMVMRPPPMALLGIAGSDAIIRSANGQTGVIREGEEIGGVKLLRIGTNRVLVSHEGRTNELVLFEGFGSESLLSKGKE